MAEAVIGNIASEIIANLVPQAIEKVGKLWGVELELLKLKDTVSTLRAVLDDAEEQYYQSRQIQVWLEKLKDAFYDAQDVLEEFNIEAMRRELRGHNEMIEEVKTFFSSSNQLAFKLKMSKKLRTVWERIEAIKADRGFHLDERRERERRKREETHSLIQEGDIMGRDDDKKTVMDFLLDSNVKENVSILPIVGIGGLGKTALAQYVYKDSRFDLKMWVCVSTDFDVQNIVKKMLACAKKEEPTEDTMELLQSKLREEIDGKRYLLVLDDLWNEESEKWRSLEKLLVGGARGSKILITTRITRVAEITGTAPPLFLGCLSDSASLKLLMQMADQKIEEIQDSDMLAIGEEIVKKCSGVPLVVRTVGSLLFFKKSKLEWSQFKDNELPDVFQTGENIKSTLELSYNHLPSHLKQCFALCSLFPKDCEIKKQTLVDLWMAEGFIQQSNRSQHLEDIAHRYFMDLLWRNFFQDLKRDPYTNEETCKMHDLMHDLACSVAGTECWVAWDDTESIHERTRHISYDWRSELLISRLKKASALRTFLSTSRYWEQREQIEQTSQLIENFKRLRILDLHSLRVEKVPRSICKLKHLTYLDLSCNRALKRLPNSITRLQSLQTLILKGCSVLEELPSDIRKLVSLRNLDIGGCPISYMPHGLGELSSLHRLTHFILPKDKARTKDGCGLGELNRLNNIRGSLCIINLGSVTNAVAESKDANLIGKHSLKCLTLQWDYFNVNDGVIENRDEALLDGLRPHSNLEKLMINTYEGESFPRWMMDSLTSCLPNLVEVHFYYCRRCKHLPPLGQLPRLKCLRMWGLTELESIKSDHSSTSTTSFPSLSKLEIDGCEKLKAMPLTPHLEELKLDNANAELLINQMDDLKKLKSLNIWKMKFLECLREECFQSLTSLESLQIMYGNQLTSLSQGMRHLSNLVDLSIRECEELDISKDEGGNILDFHGLQSLRSVTIGSLPKLVSLPQWLLQASNLERLRIWECKNLKAIPEQIEALRSLQQLEISHCDSLTSLPEGMRGLASLTHLKIRDCCNLKALPEQIEALQSLQRLKILWCPLLTSLPEGMRRLTSLTHLQIYDCPELEKRCKKDAGEDWSKIAHIPHITHEYNFYP